MAIILNYGHSKQVKKPNQKKPASKNPMVSLEPKYGVNLVHDVIREADHLSEETKTSLANKFKLVYVPPTKAYFAKLQKL